MMTNLVHAAVGTPTAIRAQKEPQGTSCKTGHVDIAAGKHPLSGVSMMQQAWGASGLTCLYAFALLSQPSVFLQV